MSKSPKYSSYELAQAQERALREARQKQEAMERERRRQEEERQRRERVAQMQVDARQTAQTQDQRVANFQKTTACAFVKARTTALANRLRQLPLEVGQCQDEDGLKKLQQELLALSDELDQVIATGEAAEEAQKAHLARDAAALAVVKKLLGAQDQARARKFDADGIVQVQTLIAQGESAMQNKQPKQAEELLAQASARLQKHKADVQQRFNKWTEERWQASAALAKLNDGLAGLKTDRTSARWQPAEIKALEERARRAPSLIEAEQFSGALTEAQALLKELGEIVARAQAAQLNEERRNYVVNGIMKVMSDMGFMIQSGTPKLEAASDPASATIIHARQLTGETIFVSVPHQGDVWYDVKEYDDVQEIPQLNGKVVATCDKAEDQITGFHKVLGEKFGIQMGELMWEDKDPLRVKKAGHMHHDVVSKPSEARRGESKR